MKATDHLRPYIEAPIVLAVVGLALYVVFHCGPAWTCVAGFTVAASFFWMKLRHRLLYGASEIAAGIFVLSQNYPSGRGGFSSGFDDGFQTFRWQIVLVSSLASIYVIVRGLDNIREGLRSRST